MSEPIRLLLESGSSFDRELLLSAEEDRAPSGSAERALAMLGVGGALAATVTAKAAMGKTAASSALATATPAVSTTTSIVAPAAAKLGSLVVVKWIGVSVIALTAATGSYELGAPRLRAWQASRAQSGNVAAAAPSHGGPARGVAEGVAAPTSAGIVTPEVAAAPSAQDAIIEIDDPAPAQSSSAPTAAATSEARAPGPAPALRAELVILDRARNALAAHDAVAANAALDEYGKKFPRGALREEASVARIEALALAGDRAGVTATASQFLREHPGSAYEKRVVALRKRATVEAKAPTNPSSSP